MSKYLQSASKSVFSVLFQNSLFSYVSCSFCVDVEAKKCFKKRFFQSYFKIHFFHISVAVFVSMSKRKSVQRFKNIFLRSQVTFSAYSEGKKDDCEVFCRWQKIYGVFQDLKTYFFWRSQVTFSTCSHGKKDCC